MKRADWLRCSNVWLDRIIFDDLSDSDLSVALANYDLGLKKAFE